MLKNVRVNSRTPDDRIRRTFFILTTVRSLREKMHAFFVLERPAYLRYIFQRSLRKEAACAALFANWSEEKAVFANR